jgi:predicted nucleotidyltransferase
LGLFGSVARGEERADSDIDFLVEFENLGPEYMADRYFGFIEDATRRFGRPVQVLTPRMVRNPFFKRSLERDLTILHG